MVHVVLLFGQLVIMDDSLLSSVVSFILYSGRNVNLVFIYLNPNQPNRKTCVFLYFELCLIDFVTKKCLIDFVRTEMNRDPLAPLFMILRSILLIFI